MKKEIDTPFLLINHDILENNIRDMADFAASKGIKLRPHIKSHKMPYIAKLQAQYGAKGITTAKLGEAEVMADSGIEDIFIAYQIIGEQKINRLFELKKKANISVAVDSMEGALELSKGAGENNTRIEVMVEIDTGLNRCGLRPGDDVLGFIVELQKMPNLIFKGIFTHGGQYLLMAQLRIIIYVLA